VRKWGAKAPYFCFRGLGGTTTPPRGDMVHETSFAVLGLTL